MTDSATIETKQFGLALKFDRVKYGDENYWKVTFDTGIILFAPYKLFALMVFELQESDPSAPKGSNTP